MSVKLNKAKRQEESSKKSEIVHTKNSKERTEAKNGIRMKKIVRRGERSCLIYFHSVPPPATVILERFT